MTPESTIPEIPASTAQPDNLDIVVGVPVVPEVPNVPTARDALILFAFFILFSFVLGEINRNFIGWQPTTAPGFLLMLFFSHIIGILLPVLIYLKLKNYNLKESLNIRPVAFWKLLVVTGLSLVFLVLLGLFQRAIEPLFSPYKEEMVEYENFFRQMADIGPSSLNAFLLIVTISVIPAVVEELLFRGVILTGLKNSSTATKAIIISGLLFGIVHSFPPQIIAISLMGIFFGLLVVKTNSILVSIWAHFLHNFMMILFMILVPM